MKELFDVYTDNKETTREAFLKLKEEYSTYDMTNWEQAARFVLQDDNGRNTLVELDFPTAEIPEGDIWLNAYEFDGEIEDYTADQEVMCEVYNGDFTNVYKEMKEFAMRE